MTTVKIGRHVHKMCTFWLNNGGIVFDGAKIRTKLIMAQGLFPFGHAEVYFIWGKISLLYVDNFM